MAKNLGKYKIFLMAVYTSFEYGKRFRCAPSFNNLRTTWYDKPRLCFYAFCIAWSAQNGICLACLLAWQPSEIKNQNQNTFLLPSSLVTGPSEHSGSWGILYPPSFNSVFSSQTYLNKVRDIPKYPNFKSFVPPRFLTYRRPWVLMLQCCWSELKLIWKCLTRDPDE